MEKFSPTLRIESVGSGHIAITFDTAMENDAARSPTSIRLSRDFTSMEFGLEGFADEPLSEVGNKKLFKGTIKLLVKTSDNQQDHILATPQFWVSSIRRGGKGEKAYIFPTGEKVAQIIRQGMAVAFSHSIGAYWGNEAYLDMSARYPSNAVEIGMGERLMPTPRFKTSARMPSFPSIPMTAANDASPVTKRFRRNMVLMIAVPMIILGIVWLLKPASSDPVHEAVAQAMNQDANSVQSQVELTKQTLLTMGLDPGKSGDVGCLAPQ